ncbi:MAG: hypothetical protein ACOZJX_11400 [Pseudomonadota bacterium]
MGFADRYGGRSKRRKGQVLSVSQADRFKNWSESAKGRALDKVIKASQNPPSLLITDQQREKTKSDATFFKNSQPISVGV